MPEDPKPRSCYDCIHFSPCKWTWNGLNVHFPFISDAHIKPFLTAVNEAIATACSAFEREIDTSRKAQ